MPVDGFSTDSLVLVDFLTKVGTTLNCTEMNNSSEVFTLYEILLDFESVINSLNSG